MGGTLIGHKVEIDDMNDWQPGFYVQDEHTCDAHLLLVLPDGQGIVDLGQISLADFDDNYVILKQGQRRIDTSNPANYEVQLA